MGAVLAVPASRMADPTGSTHVCQSGSMDRDFYTTLAQVLPVLLLALMFDSGYLERLRKQSRPARRHDPSGVLFWTKPRVRAYVLVVVVVAVGSTAIALLVLAGMLPDSLALRFVLVAGSVLVLGTLLTRVGIDVIQATAPDQSGRDS
jgi:hypothetical protein